MVTLVKWAVPGYAREQDGLDQTMLLFKGLAKSKYV